MFLCLFVCVGFALAGCGKESEEQYVALAYTNDMNGEIRACGCASQDYGGLGRRATFLSGLRKKADNLVLVDGGDFFGIDVNYGKLKADLTTQALSIMDYDGLVPGEQEFAFGVDYLLERVRTQHLPMIAANVYHAGTDRLIFPASRIRKLRGGLKLGMIGVLSPRLRMPPAAVDSVKVTDPIAAVRRELASLEAECDVLVVLAHLDSRGLDDLRAKFPQLDVIVAGHEGRPKRHRPGAPKPHVVQTARKGRFVGVVQFLATKEGMKDFGGDYIALSTDYQDHEAVVKLFQAYDVDIANQERARAASAIPPPEHAKERFAGAEACKSCHTDIYNHWKTTKHSHAFEVLSSQNREFDRDCTPCHTTGFYEIGGFIDVTATEDLIHVQCEACHGNSAKHSANPLVNKTETRASGTCTGCHTTEQTPDFEFASFWNRIRHPDSGVTGGER